MLTNTRKPDMRIYEYTSKQSKETLGLLTITDNTRHVHMSRVTRKPTFCICENKDAEQLRGNSAFVFATRIVQSLYFLNPKFQASSRLQ